MTVLPNNKCFYIRLQKRFYWFAKNFFVALSQAQTDRLKKKIESSFGPVLDKEAEAVFEAISKVWSSMVTQADAKKELAAKLQKIYSEVNRK